MKLRVLIVDDEPVARRRLRRFLSKASDVEIVAECADGVATIAEIEQRSPDVVFLDVQMPKVDGFDVLAALDPRRRPVIVFVTAFDRYALDAFEAQALDYLLKPFGEARVLQALERARTFLGGDRQRMFQEQLVGLLQRRMELRPSACLLVKGADRVLLLRPREIDYVEADGDYVRFHCGQESHLHRATLAETEERLQAEGFVRVHRSRLVNFERIKEFKVIAAGESLVVLKNGARLKASQACLRSLQERLSDTPMPTSVTLSR